MKTAAELERQLMAIHRKSYPAYKDLKGQYCFPKYVLSIDHVQGDPFASPSKLRVIIEQKLAAFPEELFDEKHKRIALQDYLTRLFAEKIRQYSFKAQGSGKSGLISVSRCGQEVLERSACLVAKDRLEVRFEAGFPAFGRTINAEELKKILFDFLPRCVETVFYYGRLNKASVSEVIDLSVDQQFIREELKRLGLAAFIANGSVLPRESGVSDRPMRNAVPFKSPASMELELVLPCHGKIRGMGIKKGITLIVGGGYHGKSTLLNALELGVYNHRKGDGREYVITDGTAMKIRAEDGRSIYGTDISMFINNLPNKKDTRRFFTEDASGSTSQAANVAEALEAGTGLMLIDEDTSATNFMIRDELMQLVIHPDKEPITPFIELIRPLYEQMNVSTILVAGSSGSYFYVADTVIQMDSYVPKDITEEVRSTCSSYGQTPWKPADHQLNPEFNRRLPKGCFEKYKGRLKLKTSGRDSFSIGKEIVDMRYVEQIADSEQMTALSHLMKYADEKFINGSRTLEEVVEGLLKVLNTSGPDALAEGGYPPNNLAVPRKQEIFAAFNRYRGFKKS